MTSAMGSSPHDIEILDGADGDGSEALIEGVLQLGEELRVELKLEDGRVLETHLSRERADELELHEGQIRFVRLPQARTPPDAAPVAP